MCGVCVYAYDIVCVYMVWGVCMWYVMCAWVGVYVCVYMALCGHIWCVVCVWCVLGFVF